MLKDKDERWNRSERGLEGALLASLRPELAAGLRLKQLIGFAYHLMLVNQLLAGRRLQEIEAAILAAAALAAHHGDDVARLADAEGIAGELLYRLRRGLKPWL